MIAKKKKIEFREGKYSNKIVGFVNFNYLLKYGFIPGVSVRCLFGEVPVEIQKGNWPRKWFSILIYTDQPHFATCTLQRQLPETIIELHQTAKLYIRGKNE